ncbi:DEAD/DEAH box helicase [Bacillus sp. FJAT-27251]|uniref:DEAD/DEAH box helicase n=1 Tax=Bacillus sp. FJAT-27251 TaxID=1684142 RepID=UPI0006A7DB88|nr:DEAD/DEAH box helicase [Bacillus sp. FJAT-27251]
MRFALVDEKLVPKPLLPTVHPTYPISKIDSSCTLQLNSAYDFNPSLQTYLSGKQLLLDELPFPLAEIQEHYENGYLIYRQGILLKGKSCQCARCGTTDARWFSAFPCARCGENCLYCRQCLMMGRVSSCSALVSWTGPEPKADTEHRPLLDWNGTLSPGQAAASAKTVAAISQSSELLIWAVCGAGKTEVLFKGIEHSLQQGGRVCIATPRTDVVLELTPRLKAAFPCIMVASLYGGSEDRHLHAPLTIATTHQLLRFYQAFHTVIVDEVDAFPFSADKTLQHAVQQARKPGSALVYLTATPNRIWQRECLQGKRAYVTIPARYHRHPLPVPAFAWCGNWEKKVLKNTLPQNVLSWIKHRLNAGKQILLFAPKIASMEKILPILRKLHPGIESVHAEDPERKGKVTKMRNREIPLLLTTTILERGVTFPNIDVGVLGAEDGIFTESALVQIAGRAGRSASFPGGEVVFFHYGKTEAMVRARSQIIGMNREGARKGLLD